MFKLKGFITSSIGNNSLSLLIRGGVVLAKLLLVLFISKNIGVEDYGVYNLFSISINLFVYFIGAELYLAYTRNYQKKLSQRRQIDVSRQFNTYFVFYLGGLPILIIGAYFSGFFNFQLLVLLTFVTIFEHVNQEFFRIFILLKKNVLGNVLIFIRQGVWIYTVFLFGHCLHLKAAYSLPFIICTWLAADIISFLISVEVLKKSNLKFLRPQFKIGRAEIKMIKATVPFFLACISYKVIEFSDRYMLGFFVDIEHVGVYGFFYGISNAVQVLIYGSVIMFYFPRILESVTNRNKEKLRISIMEMSVYSFSGVIVFSIIILILINPLLEYIGKEILQLNIKLLYFQLMIKLLVIVSYVPHYILFALKKDKSIMKISFFGAFLNLILNLFAIPIWGIYGAVLSSFVCFMVIFIFKIGLILL